MRILHTFFTFSMPICGRLLIYKCCNDNSVKKPANWFCNSPLSPANRLTINSDEIADDERENDCTKFQILQNMEPQPKQREDEDILSVMSDNSMDSDYLPCEQSESNEDTLSSNESNDSIINTQKYIAKEVCVTTSFSNLENDTISIFPSCSNQICETSSDTCHPNKANDTFSSKSSTNNYITQNSGVPDDLGTHKQNGDVRKGNKKKDFCFYCETLVLNFSRHIARNHSSEIEVQRILSIPPKNLKRKCLLDKLRRKGNYLNSNTICKPVQRLRTAKTTLPCDNCLGFFSANLLWRHRNKCTGEKKKQHKSACQNLLVADLRIDPQLKTTVFPTMRADDVSLVAKKDSLICAYGSRYIKIHREKHFINVASRKMRELARLLVELRKMEPSIKSLFDALKPKHFDLLVAATKVVAKYNIEKQVFESPTYALNIGTSLKQCAELAIVFALKRKQIAETVSSAEAELKTLIRVIESQWQYEVSSQASNDLHINKWNKVTLVPLASDLKLLKESLITKASLAISLLNVNECNKEQYIVLLETVFCRVILLNRRRPGELQRLTLDIYEKCNSSETNYEEFSEVVSPTEAILLNKFKRVVIRGKRGRGVPVLFCSDIQEHINILIKHRQHFVAQNNIYLFANPNSNEPICGYKVLKKYSNLSGAKYPKAITSTRLRKHLATISQLFSMSENDMEQLAHFMGHTMGVHRGSYRLPDDVYQTAKISKLLLLMEKGQAGEFKGKTLNEIEVDLEEDLMTLSTREETEPPLPNISVRASPLKEGAPGVTHIKEISKKNKRVLIPWTNEQKQIVNDFFSNHINQKKPPKRHECEELKIKYPEMLKNKDWLKIKVYIQNIYQKKK